MEKTVRIEPQKLYDLIEKKLKLAGLDASYAQEAAKQLVFADACGIHSHGAIRVEYYAEQIAKGGVTLAPQIKFEQTGPATAIVHGDNGLGQYVCAQALEYAVELATETGISIVGVSKMSHSGALSYYLKKSAELGYITLSMCQSDPMVVPFGGKENYFGTNPIGIGIPCADRPPVVFDMATTIQAWGKILDARAKNEMIPPTWAVDHEGKATTDPNQVQGLLPIAGPKGYGLMMMVDVLAGMLLGLPFGKHVTSMYADLTEKRNLGQLFLLIDPAKFTDSLTFTQNVRQMVEELHQIKPAQGFQQVYYPGELSQLNYEKNMEEGITIPATVYDYLISKKLHFDHYNGKNAFAE